MDGCRKKVENDCQFFVEKRVYIQLVLSKELDTHVICKIVDRIKINLFDKTSFLDS